MLCALSFVQKCAMWHIAHFCTSHIMWHIAPFCTSHISIDIDKKVSCGSNHYHISSPVKSEKCIHCYLLNVYEGR